MASTSQNFIQLAKSLPAPLQRFFARWPPAAIVPEGASKTAFQEARPNPFKVYKNPMTNKWQDPVYSQRRQAQLVQMAREHGVEHLLPETRKGTEYRLAHRVEHGLRVKGTGVGQSVKGHIHERHMIAKYVEAVRWSECCIVANTAQHGEEEAGHVGHARAHQDLEEGKFLLSKSTDCSSLTGLHRLEREAGRSGPRYRLHVRTREASDDCTYIMYSHVSTRSYRIFSFRILHSISSHSNETVRLIDLNEAIEWSRDTPNFIPSKLECKSRRKREVFVIPPGLSRPLEISSSWINTKAMSWQLITKC